MDIKGDFMKFLLEFYSNGKLVKGSNCIVIVLISKDFRLSTYISCRLYVYFRPRLKLVINKVISETQSAFIKGKQNLDGIVIAYDVVDGAKKLNKELILFKVDFEKAYGYVEWENLDSVMAKMGFSRKWRHWIMTCIGLATTSVLINGSPTRDFRLGRGLRQGTLYLPSCF
jgi:hypothetical protein